MFTEILAYNQKKNKSNKNLVLDLNVKLDDYSSETMGLHPFNGGVVTSYIRDGAECCVATGPMHVIA